MEILLLAALIVLNGLFAMSEIALVTARRARLARLAEDGDGSAVMAMKLHDDPTRFLSTVQIGITSISILNGIVGEAVLAPENERTLLRGNGGIPMVAIAITPQPGSNHIAIADEFYRRIDQIKQELPEIQYNPVAQVLYIQRSSLPATGTVAVITAGTADIPVAEEAAITAETIGNTVNQVRLSDEGWSTLDVFVHRRSSGCLE